MAHFMIAHLQNGEYHGNRILKAETAEMMHNSPLTLLPPLNRMELGFFETNINGREVIAHLGDTQNFHTSLHLFLKEGVGFYVSFNSLGKAGAAGACAALCSTTSRTGISLRRKPPPRRSTRKLRPQHAAMLEGHWINSRGSQSNFLSAVGLFGQTKVGVDAKGELVTPLKGLNDKPRRWVETAPFVWSDQDSHERLAAKVVDGKVVRFSIDEISPFMVFDRAPWYADAAWLLPGLYCALGGAAPDRRVLADHGYRAPPFWRGPGARSRCAARLSSEQGWVDLAAGGVGAVGFTIIRMFNDFNNLSDEYNGNIRFAEVFGMLAFLIGVRPYRLESDRRSGRERAAGPLKMWSIVLTLSAFIVLWIAFTFHLFSFGHIFLMSGFETESRGGETASIGAVSYFGICVRGAGGRGRDAR